MSSQINPAYAVAPSNTVGRILLDVENSGQAHYVSPVDKKRYYLNKPYDAFKLIEGLGLGISNVDLKKIPIGEFNLEYAKDSDNDGISDKIEVSLGTNPALADSDNDSFTDLLEIKNNYEPTLKSGIKFGYDSTLINRLLGRIVLQVERNGEAWYIHPVTRERFFMGDPTSAFQVMKKQSLGVLHKVLEDIPVGSIYGTLEDQGEFYNGGSDNDFTAPSPTLENIVSSLNWLTFNGKTYQLSIPNNLTKKDRFFLNPFIYDFKNDAQNRFLGINGYTFSNDSLNYHFGISSFNELLIDKDVAKPSYLNDSNITDLVSYSEVETHFSEEVIHNIKYDVYTSKIVAVYDGELVNMVQKIYIRIQNGIVYEFGFAAPLEKYMQFEQEYILPILQSFSPLQPIDWTYQIKAENENYWFATDLFSGKLNNTWKVFEFETNANEREDYFIDTSNPNNFIQVTRQEVTPNTLNSAQLQHDLDANSTMTITINGVTTSEPQPSWLNVEKKIDGKTGLSIGRIQDAISVSSGYEQVVRDLKDSEKIFIESDGYLYTIHIQLERGSYNEYKDMITTFLENLKFNRFIP